MNLFIGFRLDLLWNTLPSMPNSTPLFAIKFDEKPGLATSRASLVSITSEPSEPSN